VIAALPMYDWPEERARVDAFYAALRAKVPALPAQLERDRPAPEVWRDHRLVFSQTCWGPMAQGLSTHLKVLAQPDYSDVPGGAGPFYRSAIVARAGREMAQPKGAGAGAALPVPGGRFAYNERGSLSGWIALAGDAGDPQTWAEALVETGSHRESIRAVAAGRADLAAVDCRSWALALAHEPCARALVVVGWTAARPGLPYVCSRRTDPALAADLSAALIDMGAHAPLTKEELE